MGILDRIKHRYEDALKLKEPEHVYRFESNYIQPIVFDSLNAFKYAVNDFISIFGYFDISDFNKWVLE